MKKKIASGIAAISALTVLMAVNAGAAYAPEYREMIKQGSFQQYFKLHNDGQAEEGADAEDLISLYLFGKTEDSAVWAMVCPVVEKMTRAEFEVNDKKNQPMENIPTLKEPELLLLTEGKPELTMSGFQDEPSKIKVESIDNIERAAIKIEATSEAVDFFSAYPDIWTSDKDQSEGYAVELKKSENQYEKLCISVKYEGRRLILPYEVAAELLGLEIEDSVEAVTISFAKGKFEKDCSAFYAGIEQDDAGKDRYVFYQFDEGMYQVKKTGSSEKSRESSTENTSENTSEGQKPSSSLAQLSGIEPETETETIHISMEELLMMPEAKEAEDRKEAETENKKETEQATSEASAESETQTESENQTVTETEPQKETEQENGTEAETGTKKETEQETQTESETQTEAESETQTEAESETQTEAESETAAETETGKKAGQKGSEIETESEAASESETVTETESQSVSETETKTETEKKTETETKVETEPVDPPAPKSGSNIMMFIFGAIAAAALCMIGILLRLLFKGNSEKADRQPVQQPGPRADGQNIAQPMDYDEERTVNPDTASAAPAAAPVAAKPVKSKLTVNAAVANHKGRVRGNNEDNFCFQGIYMERSKMDNGILLAETKKEPVQMYAVCDGMGGADCGEEASCRAAGELAARKQNYAGLMDRNYLTSTLREISDAVYNDAVQRGQKSGTTVAMMVMQGKQVVFANVGDSRVYRLRDGVLEQISVDHSKVQRMINMGVLTPEQARTDPSRHVITQYMGMPSDIRISPYIVENQEVRVNDIYLLCSDGLTDMVEDKQIEAIMNGKKNVKETVRELVETALRNGGKDNVTVMLVEITRV